MPHAGLMNEREMGPEEGPLFRAKLHIRGGKRRLLEGKIAAGIITIYDALSGAMEWYVSSSERMKLLSPKEDDDLNDEHTVYRLLVLSKVLDGRFDFEAFDQLVERALHDDLRGYDFKDALGGIESVMLQLGIMPFDEAALPPEDPATY
ncbi:MAG TPA: hypothetical protein VK452_03765 [Dissulfurispiraceae bacterium]|nr:hypothetical protein [Dissulfurispiraceae bacterium]